MRSILSLMLVLCGLGFTGLQAQLKIPQASPASSIKQVIGLTEITIDYSSPAVKGREIWGELVPFDKLWRSGANSPTKISFSNAVKIEGEELAAGTYTLMTLPGEKEWEIIFNKDSKGNGVFSYVEEDDVLRVTVKPEQQKESKERLAYLISAGDNQTGTISLHWEKLKVSFEVMVDDSEQIANSIKSTTGRMWYDLAKSAVYYVENDMDLDQALTWAEQSVAMREHFYAHWTKAQVLGAKGKKAEAIAAAEKALELGEAEPSNFYNSYKSRIEAKLKEWK